jgi:hypothetical protein
MKLSFEEKFDGEVWQKNLLRFVADIKQKKLWTILIFGEKTSMQ